MNAPTLLSSCAHAAGAAEARFRVDYPNARARISRIIALDQGAASVMRQVAHGDWAGTRFWSFRTTKSALGIEALALDATLDAEDGEETRLSTELEGADVVVMIASAGHGAEAAAVVGNACSVRSIMTAGLIVAPRRDDPGVEHAVRVLRPHASVLVIASDPDFVPAMLTALRA